MFFCKALYTKCHYYIAMYLLIFIFLCFWSRPDLPVFGVAWNCGFFVFLDCVVCVLLPGMLHQARDAAVNTGAPNRELFDAIFDSLDFNNKDDTFYFGCLSTTQSHLTEIQNK